MTYKFDGFEMNTKQEREFSTWKNVWLLAQVILVIQALMLTVHMPIEALVAAGAVLWAIYQVNKI